MSGVKAQSGVRQVVYTALLGDYEPLSAQPVAARSEVEFICFTDDPDLTSTDWEIVHVEPMLPDDLPRSQRQVKILGHDRLADYDELLYVDNSVTLVAAPETFLGDWLSDHDLAFVEHSFRESVLDEFDEVLRCNLDEHWRIHEQLFTYARHYPEALDQKPTWNGIFAWRRSEAALRFATTWFSHVLRYSRRDQLSANVARLIEDAKVRTLALDNYESPVHSWRAPAARRSNSNVPRILSVGPLAAEVARARRGEQLEETRHELENEIATLRAQLDAQRESISWRMTAPLRRVRSAMLRRD